MSLTDLLPDPPSGGLSALDRLVAEGLATAPTRSLRDLRPPKPTPPGTPPSEVITSETREDRS